MRANNTYVNVAPRTLSLELVAFRPTFHERTSCSKLRNHKGRDRRAVALKHDFLLAQLGSGPSEWGANGEAETDDADRMCGGGTRRWKTVVGAAGVPLG